MDAASALLATVAGGPGGTESLLGFDKGKKLALELGDEAREDWAYWPTERVGVPPDLTTAETRRLTHRLLTSLLSARGYLKVVQIMQLEQILGMLDTAGLPRGVGHYELVLFGKPSLTDPWSWRFEGHHVSLNVAVAEAGINVTPSFFGSNPAEVRSGPVGLRPELPLLQEVEGFDDGVLVGLSPEVPKTIPRLRRQLDRGLLHTESIP